MIYLGLDTGTTSGIGVLDGDRFVHAEAHHCDGEDDAEVFTQFRIWWLAVLKRFNPNFVGIEEPLRTDLYQTSTEVVNGEEVLIKKPIGTMRTFLRLYGIRGHAVQMLRASSLMDHRKKLALEPVNYREINNKSWRSTVYPKESPPPGTRDTSAWWKERALQQCRILGWPVAAKDAAEGAMIAEALRVVVKIERFGAPKKPAPIDLFNRDEQPPEQQRDEKERPF